MRRLALAAGVVAVLGPLLAVALLVAPDRRPDHRAVADGRSGPQPSVDDEARAILERAASAPEMTSYQGVQFVSAWSSGGAVSDVLDVAHVAGQGTTVRSTSTTASPGRSVSLQSGVPSIAGAGAVGVLASHFSLSVRGADEVAGRAVDVVAARRPGAPAHAHDAARFWLDRDTGLVLRREVYDRRGRITRASAFVRVRTGPGTATTPVRPAGTAWSASLGPDAVRRLRAHDWHLPARLPGRLTLVDARRGGAGGGIVHLSFSDGIASVSVFEQRGRLDTSAMAGHEREIVEGSSVWVRGRAPSRSVWASGGTVYTVVADAPERTVHRVVAALPHGSDGTDPMDRLGRGLGRVASWFNPLG